MNKAAVINILIPKTKQKIQIAVGTAFAPTNIALCKYWGKRDQELNLPQNSSLSISLGDKGARTKISLNQKSSQDQVFLNQQILPSTHEVTKKISEFLDLFRFESNTFFTVETQMNIPLAAGLASSACGFAALTIALNQLYEWRLDNRTLSILARLGSGSACRSLWHGFVEWHAGKDKNGMDSYAEKINTEWPDLRLGLLILSEKKKYLSSREAMKNTVETSHFYSDWLKKAKQDLKEIKIALQEKNFLQFGKIAESNALAMHAVMATASPPISFSLPETLTARNKVWQLRKEGLPIFFTQDAGANLKLLFLKNDTAVVKSHFPAVDVITPFFE